MVKGERFQEKMAAIDRFTVYRLGEQAQGGKEKRVACYRLLTHRPPTTSQLAKQPTSLRIKFLQPRF